MLINYSSAKKNFLDMNKIKKKIQIILGHYKRDYNRLNLFGIFSKDNCQMLFLFYRLSRKYLVDILRSD